MSTGDQLQALLERRCSSLGDEMASIDAVLSDQVLASHHWRRALTEAVSLVHIVNGSSGSLGSAKGQGSTSVPQSRARAKSSSPWRAGSSGSSRAKRPSSTTRAGRSAGPDRVVGRGEQASEKRR